jgi:hypothetical protein
MTAAEEEHKGASPADADPGADRAVDQTEVFRPKEDTAAVDRFRKEVQAAARLEQEHIVTLYEVGEAEGNN